MNFLKLQSDFRTIQAARPGESPSRRPHRDVHPPGEPSNLPSGPQGDTTEGDLQTYCRHQPKTYEPVLQSGK